MYGRADVQHLQVQLWDTEVQSDTKISCCNSELVAVTRMNCALDPSSSTPRCRGAAQYLEGVFINKN